MSRAKLTLTTGGHLAVFPFTGLLTFDPSADPTLSVDDTAPNVNYQWGPGDVTVADFSGFPLVAADIVSATMSMEVRTLGGDALYRLEDRMPLSRAWAEQWRLAWSLTEVSNDADWIWYDLKPRWSAGSFEATGSHPLVTLFDVHLYIAKSGGSFPGRASLHHSTTEGTTAVSTLVTDMTGYHPGGWGPFEMRQQYVSP